MANTIVAILKASVPHSVSFAKAPITVIVSGLGAMAFEYNRETRRATVSMVWTDLVEYLTVGKPSSCDDVVRLPLHHVENVQLNADYYMVPFQSAEPNSKPIWFLHTFTTGATGETIDHDALMSVKLD